MSKWKYITSMFVLWVIFTIFAVLSLFRFVLTYGKVEVTFDYTAFRREDITLYWNDGTGWKDENHILKTALKGRNEYTYYIRKVDSITMLRVDPDEACDSSILHSVKVNGIKCPLSYNDFSGNEHNGSRVVQKADGTGIYRDAGNNDPFIVIRIPATCNAVIFKMKKREVVYIAITLLLCIAIFILAYRQMFLWRFFEKYSFSRYSLVLVFLLCTSMYWTNHVLEYYPDQPNIENRQLIKFPKFKLLPVRPDSFFQYCTQWCSDYFTWRNILIGTRSAAYIKIFRETPIPTKVMIGKNFMFFPSYEMVTDNFIGKMKYTQEEIDVACNNIHVKQMMLGQAGIKFLTVMPPSKQTVYSDFMPEYFLLREKKFTQLDQITKGMSRLKNDNFLCLTGTLINFRQQQPKKQLDYHYDTHWNEYGAFKAYQAVMNYIYDHIDTSFGRPMNENEVTIDTLTDNDGDLAKCMLIHNLYKRTTFKIEPVKRDSYKVDTLCGKHPGPTYIYHNPMGHGRILIFRDSYTLQWASFFAHHFKDCILIWDHEMNMQEILSYKPDIVMEEIGELFIDHLFYPLKLKPDSVEKKN